MARRFCFNTLNIRNKIGSNRHYGALHKKFIVRCNIFLD